MINQNEQAQSLKKALWDSANALRGNMDADEYRNYLLDLIFYRFLSEKLLKEFQKVFKVDSDKYSDYFNSNKKIGNESIGDFITDKLIEILGYSIKPKYLFEHLIDEIKTNHFQLDDLAQALHELIQSTTGHYSEDAFQGLFSDIDLHSKKLGADARDRNNNISKVMKNLSHIDLDDYKGDVLGDAYEYLISEFASDSGKKAGEFYTPRRVSDVLAQIVTYHRSSGSNQLTSVYDPCMGSASLLLTIGRHVQDPSRVDYHGQELNNTTYNLARMNLMLHNVSYDHMHLRNGDTLSTDWPPASQPFQFDAVTMNPPYSWKWGGKMVMVIIKNH